MKWENPAVVSAILLERAILKEYRTALAEEWAGRRDNEFMLELRQRMREQGFRIAALKRVLRRN